VRCPGGQQKGLLKNLLARSIPRSLFERAKMGFGIPLQSWLRGELRDWAESLLNRDLIAQQGMLNAELIHSVWQEHLSGKYDWHYLLWDVLMFQAWRAEYRL
jgi:asparagine synthase (glutamine-hydrolysing)